MVFQRIPAALCSASLLARSFVQKAPNVLCGKGNIISGGCKPATTDGRPGQPHSNSTQKALRRVRGSLSHRLKAGSGQKLPYRALVSSASSTGTCFTTDLSHTA